MRKRDDFDDSVDLTDEFGFEAVDESEDVDDGFADDVDDGDGYDDDDTREDVDHGFGGDAYESDDYTDEDFEEYKRDLTEDGDDRDMDEEDVPVGRHKAGTVAKIGWIILLLVIAFAVWIVATHSGKKVISRIAGRYISENIGTAVEDEEIPATEITDVPEEEQTGVIQIGENGEIIVTDDDGNVIEKTKEPRSEDYVRTYLLFGLEEINGAANTDAIMLVSINTQDNTIKLTSLLRDTYVDIPGWEPNKLNAVYARGAKGAKTSKEAKNNGAALLIRVIEDTYDVDITGYACVNFDSFEAIIDRLGGLDIELGEKEAKYLNTTNYISNPDNRNVSAGVNHLNGNQVMGYVRVRKVETLGGSNNDYGRTVRQRRVINAVISKYKSAGLSEMISIMKDCLGYIYTNLTQEQITEAIELVFTNSIYKTKSMRLPTGELFTDSEKEGIFNGKNNITYALVMGDYYEENVRRFHQFLFLDEDTAEDEQDADTAAEE